MRSTKQEVIDNLPSNAVTIRQYAEDTGVAVGYVYIKYQRSLEGKATTNYKVVSFQGINFVIPN